MQEKFDYELECLIDKFRENVCRYIERQEISQAEFARRINVHPNTVTSIFYTQTYKPSIGTVIKILNETRMKFEDMLK